MLKKKLSGVQKISNLVLLTIVTATATMIGCAATSSMTSAPEASSTTATRTPQAIAPSEPATTDPALPAETTTAQASVNFRQVTVVEGLQNPWGMAWLPDGSILVTERPGRLRVVRNGRLQPTAIAGVPPVLSGGQAGLMDITLHPNFASNRFLYLSFSEGTRDSNRTRVIRATFDGTALRSPQIILQVNQAKPGVQHFGSRFLWLPDRTLLVAIGDGGNPPITLNGELIRRQAQNLNSRLGKILRINGNGSIPVNNPFAASTSNAQRSIWTYGHRNIQGLAFDPVTNRVWSTEHGSQGGDELNLIRAGGNYGWPIVTHSREYSGGIISNERSRPGMVDPRRVWTPAIAPSGLMVYRGNRFPQWRGDLFAGGLVDRGIRRLRLDAAGNVISEQRINIGQRVRDVRQGPDGLIYVLTDERNGRLIRLEPTQ